MTTLTSTGMDIVRAFEDASLEQGFNLNIQGTLEIPLFQANQIGQLLGLSNIHMSIKDFDEDEKVLSLTYSLGGQQDTIFLTDLGLFRLLGLSRKPIARPFQKWVGKVLREIRMHGSYTLSAEHSRILTLKDEEHTREMAIKEKKMTHDALIKAYAGNPLVYLGELGIILPDGRIVCKFGETDNLFNRIPWLIREYGSFQLTDVFVCANPRRFEESLKKQPIFKQCKYTGPIHGKTRNHQELLAVTPHQLSMIKRIMRDTVSSFDDNLEKLRLETERSRWESERSRWESMRVIYESMRATCEKTVQIIDTPSRIIVEQSIASSMTYLTQQLISQNVQVTTSQESAQLSNNVSQETYDSSPTVEDYNDTPNAPISPVEDILRSSNDAHLFPIPEGKLKGRPPKPRIAPVVPADMPLQKFLDECFELDPNSKTHVSYVKSRHRLWRRSHLSRKEHSEMVSFFKARFQTVQQMDEDHNVTCSFYTGLRMKPWVLPEINNIPDIYQADVDEFVRDKCDVHIMGRVRTDDLYAAFTEWKNEQSADYRWTIQERVRIMTHFKAICVYYTGIAFTDDAKGEPGLYGIYLKTASAELRHIGYNRSPNTHSFVLKIDAQGNIIDRIESIDVFAYNVMKKSSAWASKQLSICFKDGMKGLILNDGYSYMKECDHATMLAASM